MCVNNMYFFFLSFSFDMKERSYLRRCYLYLLCGRNKEEMVRDLIRRVRCSNPSKNDTPALPGKEEEKGKKNNNKGNKGKKKKGKKNNKGNKGKRRRGN